MVRPRRQELRKERWRRSSSVASDASPSTSVQGEGTPGSGSEERKLASIGVAVTNWVTYHGFALNVNTDLSYFHLIKPCGLDPEKMTSMKELTDGRAGSMVSVKREVVGSFSEVFKADLVEGVVPLRAARADTGIEGKIN